MSLPPQLSSTPWRSLVRAVSQEKLVQNLQSKTPYKFKKSYGVTPEPQTPHQDAPWLRGPSLKKILNLEFLVCIHRIHVYRGMWRSTRPHARRPWNQLSRKAPAADSCLHRWVSLDRGTQTWATPWKDTWTTLSLSFSKGL